MLVCALFLVGFLLVHLAKMTRLYLVLMEHKIPFGRFVLLYIKTTLVNFIIPYKIGEIFRFLCISRETKHWQVGILSILVDRFFDTLALCIILVSCDIFLARQTGNLPMYNVFSDITCIFLIVLVVIAICYFSILPTYKYLNHYLIKEKSSQRSIAALMSLDVIKEWYDFTNDLISGRFALILFSSFVGWIFEILTIGFWAKIMTKTFDIIAFEDYIRSIFGIGNTEILTSYTQYSVLIMAVFLVLALTATLIGWIKKKAR